MTQIRYKYTMKRRIGLLFFLFFNLGMYTGCTQVCRTPLERAARQGVVLECHERGHWMECLVNTHEGDQVFRFPNKTVCHY